MAIDTRSDRHAGIITFPYGFMPVAGLGSVPVDTLPPGYSVEGAMHLNMASFGKVTWVYLWARAYNTAGTGTYRVDVQPMLDDSSAFQWRTLWVGVPAGSYAIPTHVAFTVAYDGPAWTLQGTVNEAVAKSMMLWPYVLFRITNTTGSGNLTVYETHAALKAEV